MSLSPNAERGMDEYTIKNRNRRDMKKVAAFRTAVHIMVLSGMNIWDARMMARKILNLAVPAEHSQKAIWRHYKDKVHVFQWVPTVEDLLDIQFRAIVSDCRGLISGTLTPRPWCDISSTWLGPNPDDNKNLGRYPKESEYFQKKLDYDRTRAAVKKMARILISNGMRADMAHAKARTILLGETK